ncbi:PREDICTED: uncharacterized protein LOC109341171 [Lupinus angustifolius]|uniref:uncharacterized protein LOC109341171 n=1 Tax=Lupinus angustifolius TaxID=3871 RepID=UPI00092F35B3|nr:PREDICTED: uncharacterized protein LOC109341171 [Lupinus angustifolius]
MELGQNRWIKRPKTVFKVGGRDWRKQDVGGKNYGALGTDNSKGESTGRISNKSMSTNYENEAVEPSYFSSSIYYGGQENYFYTSRTITEPHHVFYKKGEEDDPNGKDSSTASWAYDHIKSVFKLPLYFLLFPPICSALYVYQEIFSLITLFFL